MVLVEQSKVVTRSCRAVSAEVIRRVKCCRKDMQRFIVPMEKSTLIERGPPAPHAESVDLRTCALGPFWNLLLEIGTVNRNLCFC